MFLHIMMLVEVSLEGVTIDMDNNIAWLNTDEISKCICNTTLIMHRAYDHIQVLVIENTSDKRFCSIHILKFI